MKYIGFLRFPRVHAVMASLTVFMSTALLAVFAATSFSGAIFTTNQPGSTVNENIYQGAQDVYVNGGPNNTSSQGLPPNEVFYFEVTDPSGKILLSSDPVNCRQVLTNPEGRVFGAYAGDGCVHEVGYVDSSNGSLSVKLWPFNRTPNGGNEYKVIFVRKTAPGVSVELDGRHLDYPRSATKSDNFKVLTYIGPNPSPTPSPTPSDTTT